MLHYIFFSIGEEGETNLETTNLETNQEWPRVQKKMKSGESREGS